MTATKIQRAAVDRACELAHYDVNGEARVLVGRTIDDVLHVFDQPADRPGRRYFVEASFETDAELAVLLADYRRQAERLGACPMGQSGVPDL